MKKNLIVAALLVAGLVSPLMLSGCDREVAHEKTSSVSSDGTVKTKEKTVTKSSDGTVKTEESKKTTTPEKP